MNVLEAFESSLETNHGPAHVAEFTLFLPHIYNVTGDLIENLFCRQLKNFKNVDELILYKFQNGTSASKSPVNKNSSLTSSNPNSPDSIPSKNQSDMRKTTTPDTSREDERVKSSDDEKMINEHVSENAASSASNFDLDSQLISSASSVSSNND